MRVDKDLSERKAQSNGNHEALFASFPFFSTSREAVIGESSCVRSCPKSWDEVDDNCFFWSKVSKTWAGAEQFCGEEGRGHLASVRDQYIHDYVQAKLTEIRESEEQISVWDGGTHKGHFQY